MTFAIFGILSIAACWKWGDWRHWKLYYPTILYLLIGDLVADYLTSSHNLWAFGEFVEQYPALDIAVMLSVYPSTVILFLTHYPKKTGLQAPYMLLWAAIYVAIEFVSYHTGCYCYHFGWNIWYSAAMDLCIFPLLILHHRRPLLVWPISAVSCFLLLWWFRVPLAR